MSPKKSILRKPFRNHAYSSIPARPCCHKPDYRTVYRFSPRFSNRTVQAIGSFSRMPLPPSSYVYGRTENYQIYCYISRAANVGVAETVENEISNSNDKKINAEETRLWVQRVREGECFSGMFLAVKKTPETQKIPRFSDIRYNVFFYPSFCLTFRGRRMTVWRLGQNTTLRYQGGASC